MLDIVEIFHCDQKGVRAWTFTGLANQKARLEAVILGTLEIYLWSSVILDRNSGNLFVE